ncbi:hypothetical protein YC2023_061299 [Brassica napus]
MRRISSTVPRSHSLRSFAVFGKFNFYGIIDSPELVDLLDMLRLENRLVMRTKIFNFHKFESRRNIAKERIREKEEPLLEKTTHSEESIYILKKRKKQFPNYCPFLRSWKQDQHSLCCILSSWPTGKGKVNLAETNFRPLEVFMCSIVRKIGCGEGFKWVSQYIN